MPFGDHMTFEPWMLDLLKALIQVKAHTRKDGTQVRAHQRNVLTGHEKKDLVGKMAAALAKHGTLDVSEHHAHHVHKAAVAIARETGKHVVIHRGDDGKLRVSHERPGGKPHMVVGEGLTHVHDGNGGSQEVSHREANRALRVKKAKQFDHDVDGRPVAEKKRAEGKKDGAAAWSPAEEKKRLVEKRRAVPPPDSAAEAKPGQPAPAKKKADAFEYKAGQVVTPQNAAVGDVVQHEASGNKYTVLGHLKDGSKYLVWDHGDATWSERKFGQEKMKHTGEAFHAAAKHHVRSLEPHESEGKRGVVDLDTLEEGDWVTDKAGKHYKVLEKHRSPGSFRETYRGFIRSYDPETGGIASHNVADEIDERGYQHYWDELQHYQKDVPVKPEPAQPAWKATPEDGQTRLRGVKDPHQMDYQTYRESSWSDIQGTSPSQHKEEITEALDAGKHVPDHVLDDHDGHGRKYLAESAQAIREKANPFATPAETAYAQKLGNGPKAQAYRAALERADNHEERIRRTSKGFAVTALDGVGLGEGPTQGSMEAALVHSRASTAQTLKRLRDAAVLEGGKAMTDADYAGEAKLARAEDRPKAAPKAAKAATEGDRHATAEAVAHAMSLGDGPAAKAYQQALAVADDHAGRVTQAGSKHWAVTKMNGQMVQRMAPTKGAAIMTARNDAASHLLALRTAAEAEKAGGAGATPKAGGGAKFKGPMHALLQMVHDHPGAASPILAEYALAGEELGRAKEKGVADHPAYGHIGPSPGESRRDKDARVSAAAGHVADAQTAGYVARAGGFYPGLKLTEKGRARLAELAGTTPDNLPSMRRGAAPAGDPAAGMAKSTRFTLGAGGGGDARWIDRGAIVKGGLTGDQGVMVLPLHHEAPDLGSGGRRVTGRVELRSRDGLVWSVHEPTALSKGDPLRPAAIAQGLTRAQALKVAEDHLWARADR